ncbi:hypothetical protein VDG1235_2047 [Verrucomicrobiia bacterium DG1235]|nr:hypothetical protein VDG1235_2047 [Verrucomicrobiae bacterium DG1235]
MPSRVDIEMDDLGLHANRFDAEMGTRFKLPVSRFDPVFADGSHVTMGEPDAKHWEQVLTHLQMLGYLADAAEVSRVEIEQALAFWEADYQEGRKRRQFAVNLEGEQLRKRPWAEVRFRYLKAVATFEGEVVLRKMPSPGRPTLISRIANMRLIVFGLSRARSGSETEADDIFDASSPFGENSLRSARIGARIFFGEDDAAGPLRLLNLLGHAPAATDLFLSRYGSGRYMFEGGNDGSELSLARFRSNQRPPVWTPRWQPNEGGWELLDVERMRLQAMPSLNSRGPSADRQMFSARLVRDAQLPLNIVALELLQLRLWMLGYYEGVVDGRWGPLTEGALEGFVSDHAKAFRSMGVIVRAGWKGWRVVNLYRIFAYIVDCLDVPSERLSVAEMNEISETATGLLNDRDWRKVERNYVELQISRDRHVLEEGILRNTSPNKKRKRYFGWRRFFSAVGAFFRNVGTRLIDAARRVAKALAKGVRFAYNIFKYVWRKVRIAVRVGRLALRRLALWLFGKPFGTARGGHIVLTRWSLDYDTVQFVSKDCPVAVRRIHDERMDWMSRSLSFMCELGLVVFSILKGAVVGAWLKVAFTIYKRVGAMIRDPDYRGLFSEDLLEQGLV